MRKALHELATGYAAATGCACEAEEGSCQAVLSVEGLGIHIGLAESSGMIVSRPARPCCRPRAAEERSSA